MKTYNQFINEKKDYYEFYDNTLTAVYDMLTNFLEDKNNNIKTQKIPVIPFEQYQTAIIEFVRYGYFMRFPEKYIFRWAKLCENNILKLYAGTNLFGHSTSFPYEDFCDIFFDNDNNCEKYYNNYGECDNYLNEIGFYDWCKLPDGSDCYSDYGLKPLLKLALELEEAESAEQKLVVINKILDISHQRGDLSSLFLQGGQENLNKM